MGCVWHVGQVSPIRCTSIRIATTLGYEYPLVCGRQHVDNLKALIVVYNGIAIFNYLFATLA
jgi:hypothetical protein